MPFFLALLSTNSLANQSSILKDRKRACIEIPSNRKLPHTVIIYHPWRGDYLHRRNYTMLYDTIKRYAYWVAYPLHQCYTKPKKTRSNKWSYDPYISNNYQYNMKKGLKAIFPNGSKHNKIYDRGHQLPSADREASLSLNEDTFYFTNMTAQSSALNQALWSRLEKQIRVWQEQKKDTLYIVTGAMDEKYGKKVPVPFPAIDASQKKMYVPAYYYKVLAIKDHFGEWKTIAFSVPNNIYISRKENFYSYIKTVKEVERETGFKFFPLISSKDKSSIDFSYWGI